MSRATLTLYDGDTDGPDGVLMEVDFHDDYNAQSTAHRIIGYFRDMLNKESDNAKAAEAKAEPKVRLLLPTGAINV